MKNETRKSQQLSIGSIVRLKSKVVIPPKYGAGYRIGRDDLLISRRSVVALPEDDRGCISLVQDDLQPIPLVGRDNFLISPMIKSAGTQVDECEAVFSDVMPLLEFEEAEGVAISNDCGIALCKEHGDQLFRINDYTWAISYYEAALSFVSSTFDVGSVVVVRRSGHAVLAEVDCQENDSYDVTFQSGGDEANISRKEIIMALWKLDALLLQIKTLLNLSRCLLKLADFFTFCDLGKTYRQDKFRQSAVLGCSAAIAICEYHSNEASTFSKLELDSLVEKARIIRANAFLGLRKYPNAIADATRVKNHRDAQGILNEIDMVRAYNKSIDKRLSKEVCRWVQSATESTAGVAELTKTDER